jgi:hypothetical protein
VTEFPHDDHKDRLGGESSCQDCHHLSMPGDETTPCSRCHTHLVDPTTIFDHERHQTLVAEEEGFGGVFPENHTCAHCHTPGEAKTAENAKPCLECHEEHTGWTSEADDPSADLARAVSYLEAMHGTCIECHEKEAEKLDRPELRDCSTCHNSLGSRPVPTQVIAAGHESR